MLRCYQLGLSIDDIAAFDYGQIVDLLIEHANDNEEYSDLASQDDFDRF